MSSDKPRIFLEIIPDIPEVSDDQPTAHAPHTVGEVDVRLEDIDAQSNKQDTPVAEEGMIDVPLAKPVYDVPKVVFVVPYRNREKEKAIFEKHMAYILEDYDPSYYKIWYIHQSDDRTFNRGAMKNIGFIYARTHYPQHYRSMSFVFHDIDTMPRKKNVFDYETVAGTIKHYYGFTYALGGIASINGADFERMNGYPNFWAWGYEDNLIQYRANALGITIDRSTFFEFINHSENDPNIIHLNLEGGVFREVNRGEFDRFLSNTREGIDSIRDIYYLPADPNGMVYVQWFETGVNENLLMKDEVHLSSANKPYGKILTVSKRRLKPVMHMKF